MTAPTGEFDQPCPHGGSVVTCNECLSEFVTAERLVEDATHGDPFLSPWQTNPTAGTSEDAAAQLDMARDLTFNRDDEGEA